MNVNTHLGVFGKYTKTQYPDGSITLFDNAKSQHVDIGKDQLPLKLDTAERLFREKYPEDVAA